MAKREKILSVLLSFVLLLGLWPVPARAAGDPVTYIDEAGNPQTCSETPTAVTDSDTAWSAGWYVASGTIDIGGEVTVSGAVHLILADGCALTVSDGIKVTSGNSLTIYAQSTGASMGALTANASDTEFAAGIGGGARNESGGTITINGGTVTASGGNYAAGIGGSYDGNGGTITINGGTVTANGRSSSAGIGGGYSGNGTITINGGTVTATGGDNGAGIGGGNQGSGGTITITINGGTVTATGGFNGAGIGGGCGSSDRGANGGTITISGGEITANGSENAAGIGGGYLGSGGAITISGGTVTANGGDWGAGIGGGDNGSGGTITISGGTVTASTVDMAAGIGGGQDGNGGDITISGGTVTASGGRGGAGIGGGYNLSGDADVSGGTITISDGTVTASGGILAAGIGGGLSGAGGAITITGGTVRASGGGSLDSNGVLYVAGAGIGGGSTGESGTFSTGTNGSAVIFASGDGRNIDDQTGADGWHGVIFQGTSGQVYGDFTLTEDFTIPGGYTLTVPSGATLTNNGTMVVTDNKGVYVNAEGALVNNGTIDNASLYKINGNVLELWGAGTSDDPYQIPNWETLVAFRNKVNGGTDYANTYFKLTADIDLSSVCGADIGGSAVSWTPIGNYDNQFKGSFDGGGHTISGLYINTSSDYQGLFGYLAAGGAIQNLGVDGAVSGDYFVGGVCGYLGSGGAITNCYHTGSVGGSYQVGGVCGENDGGTVTNCYHAGAVSGSSTYIGGVCGKNRGGTITNCYNAGTVTGSGNFVGGVCGDFKDGGAITNCYNTGAVSGGNFVGGVCGWNSGGTTANCYSTGAVSGSGYVGGVCGENDTSGTITNCYYLKTDSINAALDAISTNNGAATNCTSKTAEEFTSGEVAWLLQDAQGEGAAQVWGQTVPAVNVDIDVYPVLTSDSAKTVYQVTFATQDNANYAAAYANYGGTVELPTAPAAADGFSFYKWSRTNSADGAEFTAETSVTKDMTVYAVQQEQYGEKSGAQHTVNMSYGAGALLDLYTYVTYSTTTTATEDKFDYTIQGGNDTLDAVVIEDLLIVPATAPVGTYMLTIRATEKTPQATLMSANALSVEPVDFIVTVTVIRAAPTADRFTYAAPADLTYDKSAKAATVKAAGGVTGMGAITVKYYKDGVETTPIDAGTYTVKIDVAQGENYAAASNVTAAAWTFTITQAQNSISALSCADITYGGTPSPAADADFGTPAFTYSQQENGTYAPWNTTNGAGVWYVKAAVAETDNYAGVEATARFTVNKATPAYTAPSSLTANEGQALADVALPTGWAWKDPAQSVGEAGDRTFAAVYTPDDTGNYNTVEIELTVAVRHSHSYGADWQSDETGHWHVCDCGEKSGFAAHTAATDEAVAATCTTPGKTEGSHCEICGYVIAAQAETPATGHTFGNYQHDEAEHWQKCSVCGTETTKENHTWDDGEVTTEPTCTEPGVMTYTCTICQATKTEEIAATGHDWGAAWQSDETGHWHECSVCGDKKEFAAHTEDGGVVTTPPTLDTEGVKTYSCDLCGYEMRTETIEKLTPEHEHSFSEDWKSDAENHWHECDCGERADVEAHVSATDEAVAATCTAPGKTEGSHCEICGYVIAAQAETPLAEHVWGGGEVTTQPTCTEKGIMTYTCTVCTATKTEDIDPTGHTEEIIPGKAATCTEPGFTEGKKCSVCGQVLTAQEEIPATGHTYGDYQHDEAQHWRVCGVCGTETEKEGHVFDDEQDTECNVCGYARTAMPVEPDPVEPEPVEPDPVEPEPVGPDPVEPTPGHSGGGYVAPRVVIGKTADTAAETGQDTAGNFCPKDGSCPVARFADADATEWYHDGIHYCLENGLMVGMSETTFEPETATSRAMLATILWRLSGSPVVNYALRYDDVEQGAWYTEAVRWATSVGVVKGYGDGSFGPDAPITREQLAVMLWRYAGAPETVGTLEDFIDVTTVSDWAKNALGWAVENGIVTGKTGGALDPQGQATRAEAAALLQRFCEDGR